eukprot:TRINITY_DN3169_c0_g1_i14.p1 TRINITY_DN3169_c0_g1~~TRINITY_DN3169_c0_g1_i14.p1  ORF type:complete len:549 (-),score=142.29 TRINITY_DN3169_c0_g1_i14:168-1814(-)
MLSGLDKDLIADSMVLEPDCHVDASLPVVVFLLKPDPKLTRVVVDLVKREDDSVKFMAFYCPRCTIVCKSVLEEAEVLKRVRVYELPYELIPLEKDLLTLDDERSVGDLMLGRSFNALTMVKCSIQRLQALFGRIPVKAAKGTWSCSILNALKKKELETEEAQGSEIDGLILLDRTTDLVTPLLTPMTYEGIIDEFYPIQAGVLRIKEKAINPEAKDPERTRTLPLFNKDDIMFEETRNLHFDVAKNIFPKKYEEVKTLCSSKDKFRTLEEMTDYIKRLRSIKLHKLQALFNTNFNLVVHLHGLASEQTVKQLLELEVNTISACELHDEVMSILEKEIPIIKDQRRILRILCLLSLTLGGLSKDKYNLLGKEVVARFGSEEIMRLINLNKAGLLKKKSQEFSFLNIFGGSSEWQWWKIKEKFNLIPVQANIETPKDIDYTYSNYAPLSIRLVQSFLESSWADPDSNFGCLLVNLVPGEKLVLASSEALRRRAGGKSVVLVYFVGGVTYAEVSCLRFLSKQTGVEFIVATTQFINGNRMVDAFKDSIDS